VCGGRERDIEERERKDRERETREREERKRERSWLISASFIWFLGTFGRMDVIFNNDRGCDRRKPLELDFTAFLCL
jgi:hypothetical protein